MTRFTKTLTDVIMPTSAYVNGSGSGTGWLADGLVKLGRYSVGAQRRLETHQTQGQLQYMASMAVNARRLTEASSTPTPTTPTPTTPTPTPTTTPTTRHRDRDPDRDPGTSAQAPGRP